VGRLMPALILQLSFVLDLASEELEYQKWCENSIMISSLQSIEAINGRLEEV